jgi:superfamily II RNA helicase
MNDVAPLGLRVPPSGLPDDAALDAFLGWVAERGVELYPAQEEAILALFADQHVILKTPTGSGKSLVAVALCFRAFAAGRRAAYTAPIKALVSEKFFELCGIFGAEHVGLATGDGTVNPGAPILCCTAEILAQVALRHGVDTPYAAVVMDEFHYYGDPDRGIAWQIPLITMDRARFLLMSATLGDTTFIAKDLERRSGATVAEVTSAQRPVPLTYLYGTRPLHDTLPTLVRGGRAPIYCVHFSQHEAAERAQALMSSNLCTDAEKATLKAALKSFRFDSPYGPTIRRALLHGVGIHHAGLLPKYRLLVERLSQQGLFKVICGTDTLGVGINVPIRTVLFTQLCKYDGRSVDILTVRDFRQIAGRAGRKGFDTEGLVVAQAPEWVIENEALKAAIAEGTKKKSKVVLKSAPTKGYKHWDEQTFQRLIERPPEPLESRFHVSMGLLLALVRQSSETGRDALADLDALIDASHARDKDKPALKAEGRHKLEQLLAAGVVVETVTLEGDGLTLHHELQGDFSLHHELSLFLVHLVRRLDPASPDFALDVISCVESILDHPKPILAAQVQRAKGERVAELKAQGVPYEERMELLEEVTWPKPKAEWLYAEFEAYAASRPWLAEAAVRPKGIAREIYETQAVFSTWVKTMGLERLEGVLLRYLTEVYKALVQNVPKEARTPEVDEVVAFFRAMLARVDDSLVTAWESLLQPAEEAAETKPVDVSADPKAFRARVRAELHALVRALAEGDFEEAAASVRARPDAWSADDFERELKRFEDDRGRLVFDGRVLAAWNTRLVQDGPHRFKASQRIFGASDLEEEEAGGWSIDAVVDLRDDTNPSGVLIEVVGFGEG